MFELIAFSYGLLMRPWLWLLGYLGLPFSSTLRALHRCHQRWPEELFQVAQKPELHTCTQRLWIHTSSIGEFESIRWLLDKFLASPQIGVVVTYASPSMHHYFQIHKTLLDHPRFAKLFFPLDSYHRLMRFCRVYNPNVFILLQYDFFPNLMRVSVECETIQTRILLNFTPSHLPEDLSGPLLKDLYNGYVHMVLTDRFTLIHRCQETSSLPFAFPDVGITFIAPHTRWANLPPETRTTPSKLFQIVGGNVHPSDDEFLKALFEFNPPLSYQLVWVPHDVSPPILTRIHKQLSKLCRKYSIPLRTANNPEQVDHDNQPGVILFQAFGALKHLYKRTHMAYVGGGYTSKGIHNLIEPLSWGCPVISGPRFQRQSVAYWAKEQGFLTVGSAAQSSYQDTLSDLFETREKYEELRTRIIQARNHMREGALAIPGLLPFRLN